MRAKAFSCLLLETANMRVGDWGLLAVLRIRVRKADIKPELREQFELFGKDVVALSLGLGHISQPAMGGAAPTHAQQVIFLNQDPAMKWLQEKRDEADRHETVTLALVSAIAAMIGVEIVLRVVPLVASYDRPGPSSAVVQGDLPEAPAPPTWSQGLQGRALADAFPVQTRCIGNVDQTVDHYHGARRVTGWAWPVPTSQPLAHFAVVDVNGRMVGFGEGGLERDDVPADRHEVTSKTTGWWVVAPADGASYNVYGLSGDGATACYVGKIPA